MSLGSNLTTIRPCTHNTPPNFPDTFANGELGKANAHTHNTSAVAKLHRHVHILVKFVRHITNSFETCDHNFDKNPGSKGRICQIAKTSCNFKVCKHNLQNWLQLSQCIHSGCPKIKQVVPTSDRLSQN